MAKSKLMNVDVDVESEADLNIPNLKSISQVVIGSSDWTAETILSQLNSGNIDLYPSFQRREAWNNQKKSLLIESLILGLPVPPIVLAEKKGQKGKYIVIDGKQRLLSLLHFASGEDSAPAFKLKGLGIRDDLNGLSYGQLKSEASDDLDAFHNQTIRSIVLKSWQNEDYLYLVFHRLNTQSVKLSPQELRQSLHPGPFTTWAIQSSEANPKLQKLINPKGNGKPDFRMRDVEVFIRYIGFRNFIKSYNGNLKHFLDMTSERLNADWSSSKSTLEKQQKELVSAIETTNKVFGGDAFSTWNGEEYEGRFNRAVYDIMTYYFSDQKVAKLALANKEIVKKAFEDLCNDNLDFLLSLTQTTKSTKALNSRFSLWAKALGGALEFKVKSPL